MKEFYDDTKMIYEVTTRMSILEGEVRDTKGRLDTLEKWRAETSLEIQTIKDDAVETDEKTLFLESAMGEMKTKMKDLERKGWSDKVFMLLATLCMIMGIGLILRLFGI